MSTHTLPSQLAPAEHLSFIDLRSDTVTKPTPEMLSAMVSAPVGDDVYGEDPTVNELQDTVAELLGKEAALFVPSGTMGNQLGIKVHTNPGDEVIVESESHIFRYETAGPSVLSGVQLHCIESSDGLPTVSAVIDALRPKDYYYPPSRLLCLETTHNRHGGTIAPAEDIEELCSVARAHGLATHLDGARLWNASVALAVEPAVLCSGFDTVSVCLSKGLGAPVGSVLAGSRKHIEIAHRWRKIWGGGLRQAGVLAAAGLVALRLHYQGLKNDHHHASLFAKMLSQNQHITLPKGMPQSNIVVFDIGNTARRDALLKAAKEQHILLSSGKGSWIRAVFHHHITSEEAAFAADSISELIYQLPE